MILGDAIQYFNPSAKYKSEKTKVRTSSLIGEMGLIKSQGYQMSVYILPEQSFVDEELEAIYKLVSHKSDVTKEDIKKLKTEELLRHRLMFENQGNPAVNRAAQFPLEHDCHSALQNQNIFELLKQQYNTLCPPTLLS